MLTTIEKAAEELNRDLHTSAIAVKRLEQRLTQHLANCATGTPDNDKADALRQDISVHRQVLHETPDVITELHARAAVLKIEEETARLRSDKALADDHFFNLLDKIIETAEATPAELIQLRHFAAASSNPARRFDIDRLEVELGEHDRRLKNASPASGMKIPFRFSLEEQQGGA